MHYNPLSYIRNEADILKFVNALISNTKGEGKEGDPFWQKSETLLYCALIAYIIFEGPEEDRNMNTLVDMISGMEVKEDDDEFMNAVDYMFKGLEKRKPDCFAVKQYKKYKLASGKTAKSILISCGARLAPFDIPQLREIMSYDELELDRMGDRRTATFFCISDTDSTYNFLVALAFSQMFNLLCERADNVHGGRLPHHVRVLWDRSSQHRTGAGLEKLVASLLVRSACACCISSWLNARPSMIRTRNYSATWIASCSSVAGRPNTIRNIEAAGQGHPSPYRPRTLRGNSESCSQNTQRLGRLMTPSPRLATMPGDRCFCSSGACRRSTPGSMTEALAKRPADFADFRGSWRQAMRSGRDRGGAISFLVPGQEKPTRLRAHPPSPGTVTIPRTSERVIAGSVRSRLRRMPPQRPSAWA